MSFLSGFEMVLNKVEKDAEKVFQDVFKVAVAAEPAVDLSLAATGNAAVAALYNQTVTAVGLAEQAAVTAGLNKAGAVKQAAVAESIASSVDAIEKTFGVKVDVGPWIDAAVNGLKSLSATTPTTTPATNA